MQYKYLYFKGQYRELISDFSKKPNSDLTEYEIAYSIGAYFMLGFMEEGDALYKYEFSDHSAQVIANFFKAMSLMRRSDYVKAKALFVKNYFLARDASEFEFFKFQGLAFYRYYTGDFSASFEHTNRALETCKKYQLDYEQIYVLEILGHIFIQQGKYHKGISIFSRVRSLAIELDCQGISNAIDMNVLGYKLEAGVELNKNINQTITKLKEQAPKEYYLKAQLNLQLSKAHFLNANIEKMEFHLSQAAFNIYKTGNKRQSILLNLGLAHQEFLRGDYQKALFHISNAKQSIIKGIDNVLELKLVGLEIRIMKKLQDEETLSLLLKMEEKLELRYTTYLHKIIKHRRKHLAPPLDCSDPIFMLTRAEDLKKEPNPEFILKVSKLSLLGTLNLFRYEHKEAYAYFNLVENKILIKNHGEFRWSNKGITNFQFQFLKFIFKNKKSTKSEIIKKLWNYQYDSYTHDPLIYNTISRIRKIDPILSQYITIDETVGTTIEFHCIVNEVQDFTKNYSMPKINTKKKIIAHQLNHRQIEFLNNTNLNDMISPADYIKYFNVSRITATRDLKALKELNHIKVIGKTRSIRYIRT